MRFKIGDRVRVLECSGLDSNKEGVIVPWSEVRTDHRGVPLLGQGHYKPSDYTKEVAIRQDSGRIFTMYKNRLVKVER